MAQSDSITPERDQVDRYRGKKAATKPAANAPKAAPPPRTHWLLGVLILLLGCGLAFTVYDAQRLNKQVRGLQLELADAQTTLAQARLLTARLEGQLSETDASLEATGSKTDNRLQAISEDNKEIWSEIRKLWDVSNKRNKKNIADNTEAAAQLGRRVDQLSAKLDTQIKSIGSVQSNLVALQASNTEADESMTQLETRLTSLLAEVTRIAESTTELTTQVAQLQAINDGQQAETVAEHGRAIEAIDANRKIINGKVIELERRLNDLQLRVSAQGAPR